MRMIINFLTLLLTSTLSILLLPATAAGQQTLGATLDVYVFPAAGQDTAQQSTDEVSCYNWAVQNTGSDPFELTKQAEQQSQQAAFNQQQASQVGTGAGAQGAVRGAAVGALIGEIADDDAGKGAAYGAAAGILRGRRLGRQERAQAQQQAQQYSQSQQNATAVQVDSFKRAFSVCLEAKNYMVK